MVQISTAGRRWVYRQNRSALRLTPQQVGRFKFRRCCHYLYAIRRGDKLGLTGHVQYGLLPIHHMKSFAFALRRLSSPSFFRPPVLPDARLPFPVAQFKKRIAYPSGGRAGTTSPTLMLTHLWAGSEALTELARNSSGLCNGAGSKLGRLNRLMLAGTERIDFRDFAFTRSQISQIPRRHSAYYLAFHVREKLAMECILKNGVRNQPRVDLLTQCNSENLS